MGIYIPWELFKKLLQDQISDADRVTLIQWSHTTELNQCIYDEIIGDESFKHTLLSEKWENNTHQWGKLLEEIRPPEREIRFTRKMFFWMAGVAATLFIVIGLSVGFWYTKSKLGFNSEGAYTYIYSPRGQHTQVILPDGTRVWLNSESSLRYPVVFNKKIREVTIEGEAFFHVKKNPDKPFYVNTSDLKVKVYGTSFNIKAYPNEKVIETTLIEGKLSVIPNKWKSETDNEIFLKPKDRLTFKRENFTGSATTLNVTKASAVKVVKEKDMAVPAQQLMLNRNVNPDRENLWKDGKLLFKDEKFGDLAIKLERWYDVKIHFEDEKIKDFRFSGKFDKETVNQAMDALQISSQHSYKYNMVFRDIFLRTK
jgi:transmembrane sensor